MTTPIDDLLVSLREDEYWLRRLSVGDSSSFAKRDLEKADVTAKWIAAVEELKKTAILWAALSATQRDLQDSILVSDPRNDDGD